MTKMIETPSDLTSLATDQLKKELAQCFTLTAQCLIRAAAIIKILEDRGENLSDLKVGMLNHLRKIAHGQLDANVVVRFAEFPLLLNRVSALPMPEQQRLGSGDGVTVAVPSNTGFTSRIVDPLFMTREQINLVFAKDHLRTYREQIPILESRLLDDAPKKEKKRRKKGIVYPDKSRGGLVFGRKFFPVADVIDALAELGGMKQNSDDCIKHTSVLLTDNEHQQIRMKSVETGRPITDMVRSALYASGLIHGEE